MGMVGVQSVCYYACTGNDSISPERTGMIHFACSIKDSLHIEHTGMLAIQSM